MTTKNSKAAAALLRALEDWRGLGLDAGHQHKGTIYTDDLEVEIAIRVRRHAGAAELRGHREEVLAYLRRRPELVRHCGVNLEKRSKFGGRGYVDTCNGRIVAAVILQLGAGGLRLDSGGGSRGVLFVCSRHREKHGIELGRVLAVVELIPRELHEAQALERAKRFEWERKNLADDHERGDHRSGTYLQGLAPTASEEEIRRWWDGGRGGRIPPCPRCQSDAAAAGQAVKS